jgi:hypothetical protein
MKFLFSCLSKKSSIDAIHRGDALSPAKVGAHPIRTHKADDASLVFNFSTTPTTRTTLATDAFSPGSSLSLTEALNGSFELILHADDEKFIEFVEQFTCTIPTHVSKIPPHVHVSASTGGASPVSTTTETRVSTPPTFASTTERLDQIHQTIVQLQFENEAMKSVIVRLLAMVKKWKTQGQTVACPQPAEDSQLIQELSLKLSKQEEQLEKQRIKYDKLKAKLNEKRKTCQSLLKGIVITEDGESASQSISANNDMINIDRMHFEKELDVMELEVRCLQKELASALDQVDKMREEDKVNKQLIEGLRKELDEKNALIESLTLQSGHDMKQPSSSLSSSSSSQAMTESDQSSESQAYVAKDMLQELASIIQFNEEVKQEEVVVVEEHGTEPPAMSKYLQLRMLQDELSSAHRQIREQQRELKALASTNGISEFMKLWRSEKETLEKRIHELEHELQRSILSKHDASFYSAEESSITSGSSHTISSQQSEKSPRPISPSYFLNAQVGWPPIPLELLEGIEIRHGDP